MPFGSRRRWPRSRLRCFESASNAGRFSRAKAPAARITRTVGARVPRGNGARRGSASSPGTATAAPFTFDRVSAARERSCWRFTIAEAPPRRRRSAARAEVLARALAERAAANGGSQVCPERPTAPGSTTLSVSLLAQFPRPPGERRIESRLFLVGAFEHLPGWQPNTLFGEVLRDWIGHLWRAPESYSGAVAIPL
jgi:hypothetical protein